MKTYNTRSIMVALLLTGFAGMFSESALNIALTDLMKIFDVNTATIQWLVTGYLLTMGIIMPFTGVLVRMVTTRKIFGLAAISLLVGTGLAAISQNFAMLMIARVIQAAGMGILLPLIFNTLLVIYPVDKRGGAIGSVGLVLAFAPALGPALSGIIIQHFSWHDIFWLLLIILIVGAVLGFISIENVTDISRQSLDWLSSILAVIGFGSLVIGFGQAGQISVGWTAPSTLALIGVGSVALIGFGFRQFHTVPLLDLHVFKYPMYLLGVVQVLATQMVLTAILMLFPMFLQTSIGLSVMVAGLAMLPGSLLNGVGQLTAGRLFDHLGPRWLVIPGWLLTGIGLIVLMHISIQAPLSIIVVAEILVSVGSSMIWPAQTNALNQLPMDLYSHGSAIITTLTQVMGAVSTAVATGLMNSRMNHYFEVHASASAAARTNGMMVGVQRVFGVMLVLVIVELIISLFLRKSVSPENEIISRNN